MIDSSWLWSHLSLALLISAVIGAVGSRWSRDRRWARGGWWIPTVALAIGVLLSHLPAGDVDLAGQFLAYSGELSFVTLVYLAVCVVASGSAAPLRVEDRHWNVPRAAWAIAGLALYGSALSGRGPDLYAFGFGTGLVWPALALSALAAVAGRWLAAVLLLGTVWAWQCRLSGGVNFWDYAIDPFIFFGSLTQVLWAMLLAVTRLSGITGGQQRKLTVAMAESDPAPAN